MAKDAFDRWWEWVEKPADSPLTIPAYLHDAVMRLPPEERLNRVRARNDDDGPMTWTDREFRQGRRSSVCGKTGSSAARAFGRPCREIEYAARAGP
jgi:hypothetical protein